MSGDTHASTLVEELSRRQLTIACAESLTGGLVACEIVGVPGASRVFLGGVIAYHTALKSRLLDVDPELLAVHGPVHEQVAKQMAEHVRHACTVNGRPADIGVATTGVAGPDPDPQSGQRAGTVWIAGSVRGHVWTRLLSLTGSRDDIRRETVQALLTATLLNLSHFDSHSEFSRE